jgi:hypothetical protein
VGESVVSGLPWVRFDTDLPDNPKILRLISRRGGSGAAFVYCCGLAYAGRHGTDGFIPTAALTRVHGKRSDAAALVDVGLWDPSDEGWWIHGWDEYQQSSETSERIREDRQKASKKGNCARWHPPGCKCWATDEFRPRAVP